MELALVAILLVAATVAIHAFRTVYWLCYLVHRFAGPDGNFAANRALPAVTSTAVVLVLLHAVEVVLWALAYLLLLPGDHLGSFEEAAYFSVVTFSTLGYSLADHLEVSEPIAMVVTGLVVGNFSLPRLAQQQ